MPRFVGPRDKPQCLPIDNFRAAALIHSDAVALRDRNAQLSYRELADAVDRLAAELPECGVGSDIPVGICLDRSFDYVIAMLAASRAGGAFLPLDPRWPEERLRFVLDDSRAPVVLTNATRLGMLVGRNRQAIAMDVERPHRNAPPSWPSAGPDSLAYIIYTSGTTGEPKGVEISHRNLQNLIDWHTARFTVTARDRGSSVAGLGFDAAIWEFWPYLCAGASVTLADELTCASGEALRRFLVAERIGIAFVPTPHAETLITAPWPSVTALRYLLTGGDALHARPIAGLPFAVVNNYGPTECTVVATSGIVAPEETGMLPHIGRPIDGVHLHILDSQSRPAAPGETGEICIGGASVGRGYRGRPELTAKCFVPDPFSGSGARLYRTGDTGKLLPDGCIAFCGRSDAQIKIRGHRIELEEISAALDRHPQVARSVAHASGEGSERRIVIYVVPKPNALLTAEALRSFLASSLPDYMLPASFVQIAALPLTASGKIDRAALPSPESAQKLPESAFREACSPVERRIAGIVAELLHLDRVGIDDNFFLLGGHSLLGTQLVLRARDAFGVELTLRDLFKAQTVEKLAAAIEGRLIERLEQMSDDEVGALLAS